MSEFDWRKDYVAPVAVGVTLLGVSALAALVPSARPHIGGLLYFTWSLLTVPVTLPLWLVLPLVVFLVVSGAERKKKKPKEPPEYAYVTDVFDGVRWRWRWNHGQFQDSLVPYCVDGQTRLVPGYGAYRAAGMVLRCDTCQASHASGVDTYPDIVAKWPTPDSVDTGLM